MASSPQECLTLPVQRSAFTSAAWAPGTLIGQQSTHIPGHHFYLCKSELSRKTKPRHSGRLRQEDHWGEPNLGNLTT